MRLFFIFLKTSLKIFFLSLLIFQSLSLMPPLAGPALHFYSLFRKLPSTSQPRFSFCLPGALYLRRRLFGSDSLQFLSQPMSSELGVVISICHVSCSYFLLSSYILKILLIGNLQDFLILLNRLIILV